MVTWHCKFCRDKKYIHVSKYVNGVLMYCPKPCSCTVIGHTAIDVFNSMRDNDDCKLIRFPIEKVRASTRKPVENSKVLDILDFVKDKNKE